MQMMRVLQAEESLRHVTEVAAGMGTIKKGDRDQILNAWRRDAQMGAPARRRRRTLADLSAPGFPIVEVNAQGAEVRIYG